MTAGSLTWRDVMLPNDVIINFNSRLVFEGFANIFLIKNHFNKIYEIHILSATGQCVRQLLSLSDLAMRIPLSVAVDCQCDSDSVILYLHMPSHALSVFGVIYKE